MCRNIKPLFNFEPEATDDEIKNAAIQFVRKISGFTKPSEINLESFDFAVEEIFNASKKLLKNLKTNSKAKSREEELNKLKLRNIKRFKNNL